jgi:hypothetical protein
MRITSKGQVTIPAAIRERAGLLPHTEGNSSSTATPCASSAPKRGTKIAEALALSHICEAAATSR